jgi:hypothetical protein
MPATATPAPTPSPTPLPQQQLTVSRSNFYRGLQVLVDEARSGPPPDSSSQPVLGVERSGVLPATTRFVVVVRVRLHNANAQNTDVPSCNDALQAFRLRLPSGEALGAAFSSGDYTDCSSHSLTAGQTASGWLFYALREPVPLEPLQLVAGAANETPSVIPFTGPEQVLAAREWTVLHSTEVLDGIIWSVSGGTIRTDIPGQQANPGQEFIVLKVRATNTTDEPIPILVTPAYSFDAKRILRLAPDNGVLLEPSAELDKLGLGAVAELPARAERDGLYAWQVPRGQQNPTLVIRRESIVLDGARQVSGGPGEARLPIGPLPPPP